MAQWDDQEKGKCNSEIDLTMFQVSIKKAIILLKKALLKRGTLCSILVTMFMTD